MNIDTETLKKLGYCEIIRSFSKFLCSEENIQNLSLIKPFTDIESANREIDIVNEFFKIFEIGTFPIGKFENISNLFDIVRKEGSFLQPKDFISILNFLKVLKEVKKFISELSDDFYKIKTKFLINLHDFNLLYISIVKTFNEKGEFLDDASYELKRIRSEIKSIKDQIQDKLHNILYSGKYDKFLQDKYITIRNNRYVLPFKLNFAQKIKGIVQDYSQTRETVFVEPEFIVQMNNRLAYLYQEEYNEKIKILHELTEILRSNLIKLEESYLNLRRIDILVAKARFGKSLKGIPVYLDKKECEIYNALNPILLFTKEKVIPIDLIFKNRKVLIVSGANTGGKTVSLKTLGLIILMAQTGFPVPVSENSKIRFFEKIFVEIGDEQNIMLDLSSFSAHIKNINSFIRECDNNTLVLIDELGSGTDPQDGAAIGRAIVEYILKKNSYAMITTHIQELKYLNYLYEEVENVAVDFDEELMKPKYKLIYGIAGKSYGIDIAEKLNMPEEIILLAKKYYDNKSQELSKIIYNVELYKKELIEKERNLILELQKLKIEKDKFIRLKEKIKKEKDQIIKQVQEKYRKRIDKLLNEIELMYEKCKKILSAKETSELAKEKKNIINKVSLILNNTQLEKSNSMKNINDFFIGQRVKVLKSGVRGKVLNININRKEVEVLLDNNLKINLPYFELKPLDDFTQYSNHITIDIGNIPECYSINLIGKTVEEAKLELDRFFDKVLLKDIKQIEIIHGIGSGKLKKGIHTYLKEKDFIKNFYSPEDRPGGAGITIVEIE